jgi:hypothetical protein
MSLQKVIFGKSERIYREYRNQGNTLTDPTSPFVTIYDPEGITFDSGSPTKESTGVYYFNIGLTTASATKEGIYQAYWEGTIGSSLVTMDTPQYFWGIRVPWQITKFDSIINSIRRMIGDTNPEGYRVSTQDLYYFFADAVGEVQADHDFGYDLTVTPTSLTFSKELYTVPYILFKLKTAILVLESILYDSLYDAGAVKIGDIQIDLTSIIKLRMEKINQLKKDYQDLLYNVKMDTGVGYDIDTYVQKYIINTTWGDKYIHGGYF